MIEMLQPTSEPGWVLDHEGYSVLTENAVESRFAFGNGFLGIRQASERRSQQEGTSSFLGSPLVCPKTPQRRVLSG
jgi:trehalose/maltose hydrolase-like predicted phosphorylase